jgi:hypothetical protein
MAVAWAARMTRTSKLVYVLSAGLLGCQGQAAPTASSSAAPTAAAAPKCASDYTKVDQLGFCIKLPPKYAVKEIKEAEPGKQRVTFAVADDAFLDPYSVSCVDVGSDLAAQEKESYQGNVDPAHNEVKATGETPGGKGKWVYFKSKEGPAAGVGAIAAGSKRLCSFWVISSADGPSLQTALDVGKTMTPTD